MPDAGDIVWLQFDPSAGHEHGGHRPAIVLSPLSYNGRTGMMLCCPLTTRIKGYPFEVRIGGVPDSVVLCDQLKSLDWRARRAVRKTSVTTSELSAVRARVRALVGE